MIRSLIPKITRGFSYSIGSFDKFHTPRIKIYLDKSPPKLNLDSLLKNPQSYKSTLASINQAEDHTDKVILLLNGIQRDLQESLASYQKGQEVLKLLELLHKQELSLQPKIDLRFLRIYSLVSKKVRNDRNQFFDTIVFQFLDSGFEPAQFGELLSIILDHYQF